MSSASRTALAKIDFALLRRQKAWLVRLNASLSRVGDVAVADAARSGGRGAEHAEGLIQLLDALQEAAVLDTGHGEDDVYGPDDLPDPDRPGLRPVALGAWDDQEADALYFCSDACRAGSLAAGDPCDPDDPRLRLVRDDDYDEDATCHRCGGPLAPSPAADPATREPS